VPLNENITEQQMWTSFLSTRDQTVRGQLIEHYKPLVERVLRRFKNVRRSDREDLRGAGFYGLCRAVDMWNPARMEWERFASIRIYFECVNHIRSCDWVPKGIRAQAQEMEDVEEALTGELGRPPTDAEIAERMETSPDELDDLKSQLGSTEWKIGTLDYRVDTEAPWSECVPDPYAELPEEATLDNEGHAALHNLLSRLTEREQQIIRWRFIAYPPLSQKEIARRLGVHESRVSQVLKEALARARELAKQRPLRLETNA
jgi:RNA polymerase sigma factor for flagellar operon FliA